MDRVQFEPIADHRDELVTTGTTKSPRFQSKCNCGAASPIVPAAGMAHGWHANHIEEVIKEMSNHG